MTTQGLRWRTAKSGWQSAAWSDVSDYYIVLSTRSHSTTASTGNGYTRTIEMRDGRRLSFDFAWKDHRQISDWVVRNARNAKVMAWGFQGARPVDWPRTFGYDARRLHQVTKGFWGLLAFFVVVIGGVVSYLILEMAQRHTWIWFNAIVSLSVLAEGGFIIWLLMNGLTPVRQAQRWIKETFTVTEEGFVFHDGGGDDRFIPWNKVTGYDFNAGRKSGKDAFVLQPCVIATVWGQRIVFNTYLTDARLFMEVIRQRATEGVESQRDSARAEALGGEAARWSGGEEGLGDLVFHARTRAHRAGLILPWAMIVSLSFVAVMQPLNAMPGEDYLPRIWGCVYVALGTVAAGVFATICYYRIKLTIGPSGVGWEGIFRQQSMAWEDIQSWSIEGEHGRIDARDGRTIRFNPTSLAYGSEIETQLRERAASREEGRIDGSAGD